MQVHPDKDINELISLIDFSYSDLQMEVFQESLAKLAIYMKNFKDELASAIYDYHMANIKFDENQFDECAKILHHVIPIYEKYNTTYYLIRSYNVLAILKSQEANYYECLGYYIKALHLSEKHPEYNFSYALSNNIGNLFVWLNEFEQGLTFLLKANTYIGEDKTSYRRFMILINIIECYGCLKQYRESYAWSKHPIEIENGKYVFDCLILCNKAEQLYDRKEFDKLPKIYDTILKNVEEYYDYIYHFRTLLRILKICISSRNREYAKRIMTVMDGLNRKSEITTFSYDYAELKMKYYYAYRDMQDEDFCIYTDEYYKESSLAFHRLRKTYAQSMILRLDIEKVKDERQNIIHENERLEKDLELDSFTKIYNKEGLKKHCIVSMKEYSEQTKHAMYIIDIDFFKHVNDTYGHKIGDDVLLQVAKLLKSVEDERILVGRFGGDEFMLVYLDCKHEDDVRVLAKSIVERARKLTIPKSNNEHISLSIGISIEHGICDFDTMFFNADKALYDRKHQGRDGYYIKGK